MSVTQGRAYTDINRRDGRRIVTVTADVRPRSRADQVLRSVKAETLPKLQAEFPGLGYSFEGRQADRRKSMNSLFRGMGIVLLVIFAMLAVPLNSYIQPAIIMASISFGIGATLCSWIRLFRNFRVSMALSSGSKRVLAAFRKRPLFW